MDVIPVSASVKHEVRETSPTLEASRRRLDKQEDAQEKFEYRKTEEYSIYEHQVDEYA